jgi:hypothetical protein
MNRLTIPIVVALLTAACTGAALLSSSKDQPVTLARSVQVNGGANAGSDTSDITNRPNPPVHKGGTTQIKPAPTPQNVAPAAGPFSGSATDRCGSGIGIGIAGSHAGTAGKRLPMPMCAVQ